MRLEDCKSEYETYKEIIDELMVPIKGEGLEVETLARLYESKLVYLRNLRAKCFYSMNRHDGTFFTTHDHNMILQAIEETQSHLRDLILMMVTTGISKRKVS